MKTQFSKKVLAILASAVLLVCSFAGTFVVSAEDPIATPATVNGVKYYIVANAVDSVYPTVTIDLGDGVKTYNTQSWQSAIEGAATAGVDEAVVALTEGTYSITSDYLPNNNTNGKLSIIGYGTTADKIVLNPTDYFRIRYNAYLDNFTIYLPYSKSFLADGDVEFGPNFRLTGQGYLHPWAYTANANTTDHTVVIDGASMAAHNFAAFGVGDFVKQTTAGGEGHLYEVTVNSLTMGDHSYTDCGRIILGNYRASLTYTGNYIFTVNNATPHASRPYIDVSKASGAVTTFNGTATVILNNGMAGKWTVTDEAKAAVDYVVTAPAGEYVTVTAETKKAEVPTFEISNNNGFVPEVNGVEVPLTDGKYLFTPDANGTYAVTYNDPNAPEVYEIDGEKFAFAAADGKVEYNEVTYNAYETFELAYNAIKATGGTIVLEGTHILSTQTGVTSNIKIVGADSSAILQVAGYTNYTGNLEIDNIKFQSKNNAGIEGYFSGNFKLGSGVTLANNNTLGFIGMNNTDINSWNAGDTLTMHLSAPGTFYYIRNTQQIGTAEKNVNYHLILDGTGVTSTFGNSITVKNTVYGNFTLIINDASRIALKDGKKQLDFTHDATGKMSVILNNGADLSKFFVNDTAGAVDYILNVATGGYANIKTEGSATAAPTYVIAHNNGYVPLIDGVEMTKTGDEYIFAPETTGTYNITFYNPDAPQVYEIEGEKFAFVAADGKVDYNDVTYNAYETFELAYKAIIGVGGTIVVEGTQTLYTESTAAKAIKVLGLGVDNSKLIIANYGKIYGEIAFDEITWSTASGGGDVSFAVDRSTIGPNMKSLGNFWLVGYVTSQPGEICYLKHNGNSTAFMLNVSQKGWQVPADTNIREYYNGGYVNHDIQVNGAVQGNMTYFFNDVSRFNTKKVTVSKDATGVLTLVFNNGITNMTINDTNGYVDYIVNVAEGGYADIKTEGDVQTAPVFVITAPEGKVPVVGNKPIAKTAGEYLYQPTGKETDITFIDEVSVDVLTGAAVRFGTPTGLRFITNINGLSSLSTIGASYEAYTLIAPIDYVDAVGTFTKEAFDAESKTYLNIKLEKDAYIGDGEKLPAAPLYNAAIVNIKESNYDRGFAARTYVVITYADGNTETIYSDFSETDNVRSVKEVAQACLDTEDYDNDNQRAILEGFVG